MRFLALALLLSGCATLGPDKYVFSFESQPSGAMVYSESGKALGTTPFRGVVTVPLETRSQDRVESSFTVVWASGAKLQETRVWHPKQYKSWRFAFDRPAVAGLDIDMRQANEQQRVQQAESSAGYAALLSGMAASQRRRSSTCLVSRVGPSVVTADCD